MNNNPNFPQPMGPLSVGNVASAALRLYRDRFKPYFGVSFRASLWSIFPFIVLIPLAVIFGLLAGNDQPNVGILLLIIPVWLVFGTYCWSHALKNAALISRLAFKELINQPETVQQARKNISKLWSFFWLQFLVNLIMFVISLLLSMAQGLVIGLPASLIKGGFAAFLILVGYLLYYVAYFWFYARFFISETPFVIEENSTVSQAIGRSWTLTKGFVGRILLIITVAILITIPVYLLALIPIFSLIPILSLIDQNDPTQMMILGGRIVFSILGSFLLFLLLNIAALPFWQIVKGVVYYDLCARKEGLGLDLNDSL
ncbi:hypothetical protein VB715_00145 [Crocosphaera sp. UHCC 0190]|uniref:hypothetical protein n=1 Tax=Crocosphaera sp. UHCC 0190 TaxID=3110246 RepID=UPI002B213F08|nr:hypothetical protein [Crocosphaera sp. UHCC 0190]MEA5508163.1 hypothetical protein [Crocosphaera sp. UHCC 0190]